MLQITDQINLIICAAVGLLIGVVSFVILYFIKIKGNERKIAQAKETAKKILSEADKEAKAITKEASLEAKETVLKSKAEFEKEFRESKKELQILEKRLMQKEENIDRKIDFLSKKELSLQSRESELKKKEENFKREEDALNNLIIECKRKLEKISGMTVVEAKNMLIESIKEETRHEAIKYIKKIEDEAREYSKKKAKDIIVTAIQRTSSDIVPETTVSVLDLPSDEMKGRIIGREGRNIRAFEIATGINLIIDDTPEAVILSGFDPIKREIAKRTLERLINDGRIHPGKIEEILSKVKDEVAVAIREFGEQAAFDTGIHEIHPEIIKLLGKLKFRTSYAQNVLEHSKEVANLCGIMAAELGFNPGLAKRVGLLHDIGKAVDQESEGSHAKIGAELAKKYGESSIVINAIESHHEESTPQSLEAVLVQAADALSAARPGARREMLESYIKRLEKLEELAASFKGVEKSYAIQAGREIRIIVNNNELTDEQTYALARDIAQRIEKELSYPGQIKVTAIRETRAVEYAK